MAKLEGTPSSWIGRGKRWYNIYALMMGFVVGLMVGIGYSEGIHFLSSLDAEW